MGEKSLISWTPTHHSALMGGSLRRDSILRTFGSGAWQEMLQSEGIEPYGTAKMPESVRSLRNSATRSGSERARRIVLRIMSLEFVGKMGKAELGDITGVLIGTINEEVLRDREKRKALGVGAVLVLRDVSGLLCFERELATAAKENGTTIHLSIYFPNIVAVFGKIFSPSIEPGHTLISNVDLKVLEKAYTRDALSITPLSDDSRRLEPGQDRIKQKKRPKVLSGVVKSARVLEKSSSLKLYSRFERKEGQEPVQVRTVAPKRSFECALLANDGLDKILASFDLEGAIASARRKKQPLLANENQK